MRLANSRMTSYSHILILMLDLVVATLICFLLVLMVGMLQEQLMPLQGVLVQLLVVNVKVCFSVFVLDDIKGLSSVTDLLFILSGSDNVVYALTLATGNICEATCRACVRLRIFCSNAWVCEYSDRITYPRCGDDYVL